MAEDRRRRYARKRRENMTRVEVWLTPEEMAELEAKRQGRGVDRSELIRSWIHAKLGRKSFEDKLPNLADDLERLWDTWDDEAQGGPPSEPRVRLALVDLGYPEGDLPRVRALRARLEQLRKRKP